MDTTLITGIIGVVGTLFGSGMGYLGAVKSVNVQIKHQEEIDRKLQLEKDKYVEMMILTFIKNEIELNYNYIGISSGMKFNFDKVFPLKFDEYERVKYKMLENPTQSVREINKIYQLFKAYNELGGANTEIATQFVINEIISQKEVLDNVLENIQEP